MIGEAFSHYKILDKIGEGGMGIVYKAIDENLDRLVAIKFLPVHLRLDPEAEKRFITEAKTASSFDHSNICSIYEIDKTSDNQLYIVMAYYDGVTLDQLINTKQITTEKTISYCIQIAKGLERAHKKGIIHRDIKPANIIITNDDIVKILDFGLAKSFFDPDITKIGTTLGTVSYMSPEQAKGTDVNHQTDIWSLGAIMYQMLTSVPPFRGDYEQAIIYSILNEEPESIENHSPDCSHTLMQIVNKCLEKVKVNRYQSVSDLLNDLEQYSKNHNYIPNKVSDNKITSARKIRSVKKTFSFGIFAISVALLLLFFSEWDNIQDYVDMNLILDEQHLIILPLTNIGGDPNRQVLCDGLMETFSSKLTQLEKFKNSLWIVPASEVIHDKIKSSKEARNMYGVNLAVTGSLQFLNETYHLTLNLINTENLRQLNSSLISSHQEEGILSLQNKSIIKLLEMLHIELDKNLHDFLKESGTVKPEAYVYYVLGLGYMQRYENIENIEEAIKSFKISIEIDSLYALAYAGLGQAYWRKYELTRDTNFVQKAVKECEYAFKLDSLLTSVNISLGIIYTGTGEYSKAIEQLKYVINTDPMNASAYLELGHTYTEINNKEDAELMFKKAIKMKPGYWAGYSNLGYFYYKIGEYEKAIEQFQQVIKITPDNYRGYNNLGGIYYMLERWSDAREMFEKSLAIRKSYNIYSNLGTLYYIEKKYPEAIEAYQNALQINQNDYLIWGNLASAYDRISGNREKAIEAYNHAIENAENELKINPNDPDIIADLAAYYSDIENESKSINLLEQALSIASGNIQVYFRAAGIYETFGKREKALFWIGEAIKNGYSVFDIENQPELSELIADSRYKNLVDSLINN